MEKPLVLLVGQHRSIKESNPWNKRMGEIAEQTLLEWLQYMDPNRDFRYEYVNVAPKSEDRDTSQPLSTKYISAKKLSVRYKKLKPRAVLALGQVASRTCTKVAIEHFKLPNPSPKSTKTNDRNYMVKVLRKGRAYLSARLPAAFEARKRYWDMPEVLREAWEISGK